MRYVCTRQNHYGQKSPNIPDDLQDTCAETYQWFGIKQTQQKHMRECCFTAARLPRTRAHTHTHTHTHTHVQKRIQYGPLIIRNPVLLLIPHSSHVLQGWLRSLCIYLSVVQRLHAGEIKSKGQRAGGDMSALLNSAGTCTCPSW